MLSKILLIPALAATSFAAPAVNSRQAGANWIVSQFSLDDTTTLGQCSYHYFIDENSSDTTSPVYECSYTIIGDRTTPYQNQKCDQQGTRFSINQGYEPNASPPFITVVVSDLDVNAWAFFGWNNDELAANPVPDKTSPSDTIGVFPSNDVAQKFKASAANKDSPVLKATSSKDALKVTK